MAKINPRRPKEYQPKELRPESKQEREAVYLIGLIEDGKYTGEGVFGPSGDIEEILEHVGSDGTGIIYYDTLGNEELLYLWRVDRWVLVK